MHREYLGGENMEGKRKGAVLGPPLSLVIAFPHSAVIEEEVEFVILEGLEGSLLSDLHLAILLHPATP